VLDAPAGQLTVQAEREQAGHSEKARSFSFRGGAAYEIHSTGPATLFKATVPFVEQLEIKDRHEPAAESPSFRGRQPEELAFGTSGLRGLVTDITDLEAYINTRGFWNTPWRSATLRREAR